MKKILASVVCRKRLSTITMRGKIPVVKTFIESTPDLHFVNQLNLHNFKDCGAEKNMH
jgi:hypothetical protein